MSEMDPSAKKDPESGETAPTVEAAPLPMPLSAPAAPLPIDPAPTGPAPMAPPLPVDLAPGPSAEAPQAPFAGEVAPGPTLLGAPSEVALQAPPPPRVTFRERLRRIGGRIAGAAARFEAFCVASVKAGTSWLPWLFVIGFALGSGVWGLTHRSRWGELFENKLPLPVRLWTIPWLVGGVVLVTLFITVAHLIARRKEAITFPGSVQRWGPRLLFVFLLPISASLLAPEALKAASTVALLHCIFGAAVVLISAYSWLRPTPAPAAAPSPESAPAAADPLATPAPSPESASAEPLAAAATPVENTASPPATPAGRAGKVLAAIWVGFLWLGHAALFSYFALVQHFSLSTRTIDLGYYDNIFYQSIHGRWLACSFLKTGSHAAAHFDPILVVLSPLYLIYPRAELLLVLQSVWIGSGAIPAYLIAHRRLGSRLSACALALVYVLHPALQGANMYEFHSLSLVAPVFLWLLNFLEKGSLPGYFITLAVLLLCREDAALLACFVGLAAILAPSALTAAEDAISAGAEAREKGEKRRRRMGVVTIGASVVYFVVVKLVFMTSPDILNSGKDAYSFAYYYEALIPPGTGMGGLLLSLTGNPVFVLRHVFTEAKLVYLATVFLPVLFLPFVARPGRWVLAYGLIFCLLASRTAVFSTHFQYATLLYPAAIAFAPAALVAIRTRPRGFFGSVDMPRLGRALVPAIVAATMLVSWQFGAIVPNGRFKGGFVALRRVLSEEDKATYAWLKGTIAQIPRDAKVSVTDRMGPHVSNRRHAYFYPARTDVDFVLIDEGDLKGNDQNRHKTVQSKGTFKEVARRGKIVLYKKK